MNIEKMLQKEQAILSTLEKKQHEIDVLQARLTLEENKQRTQAKKQSRRERTHRLIILGAALASVFPQLVEMGEESAREQAVKIARFYERASDSEQANAKRESASEEQERSAI